MSNKRKTKFGKAYETVEGYCFIISVAVLSRPTTGQGGGGGGGGGDGDDDDGDDGL
jgi:hypothetical protein